MTVTLDTRTLIVIGGIVLLAAVLSSKRLGCQTAWGCLVGVVCIVVGVVLLGMSGVIGGV
jgi:hypothetical protein